MPHPTGLKADLNGVELRNIMMVSSGKGADGRLLGTILNKSDHDITVTFAFPSGEKSVKVAGDLAGTFRK